MFEFLIYGLCFCSFFGYSIYKLAQYENTPIYNLNLDKNFNKSNSLYQLFLLHINCNNLSNKNILVLGNSNSTTLCILSFLNKFNNNIHLLNFDNNGDYKTMAYLNNLCTKNDITFVYKNTQNLNLFGKNLDDYDNKLKQKVIETYCNDNNIKDVIYCYNLEDLCNMIFKSFINNKIKDIPMKYEKNNLVHYSPFLYVSRKDLDDQIKNSHVFYNNNIDFTNKKYLFTNIYSNLDNHFDNWKINLIKNFKELIYLNGIADHTFIQYTQNISKIYNYGIIFNFQECIPTFQNFSRLVNNQIKISKETLFNIYNNLNNSYVLEVVDKIDDNYIYYCKNNLLIFIDKTSIQELINTSDTLDISETLNSDNLQKNNNDLENFLNGDFYFVTSSTNSYVNKILNLGLNLPIKILNLFDFCKEEENVIYRINKSKVN